MSLQTLQAVCSYIAVHDALHKIAFCANDVWKALTLTLKRSGSLRRSPRDKVFATCHHAEQPEISFQYNVNQRPQMECDLCLGRHLHDTAEITNTPMRSEAKGSGVQCELVRGRHESTCLTTFEVKKRPAGTNFRFVLSREDESTNRFEQCRCLMPFPTKHTWSFCP